MPLAPGPWPLPPGPCLRKVMLVNAFGCAGLPLAGYDILSPSERCTVPRASGWFAALVFPVVVTVGAYILPTVATRRDAPPAKLAEINRRVWVREGGAGGGGHEIKA